MRASASARSTGEASPRARRTVRDLVQYWSTIHVPPSNVPPLLTDAYRLATDEHKLNVQFCWDILKVLTKKLKFFYNSNWHLDNINAQSSYILHFIDLMNAMLIGDSVGYYKNRAVVIL